MPADPLAYSGPKTEDRAAAILQAAFQEFTISGYAAARMESIAARAGITKGLIYFYFKNKEALFATVFRECVKDQVFSIMTQLNPAESMASHIARVMNTLYDTVVPSPFFSRMIRIILVEGQRFPELRARYLTEVVGPLLQTLRGLLDEGARRGEWLPERVPQFLHVHMSPALVFCLWQEAFGQLQALDIDQYRLDHQTMLLASLGLSPDQIQDALAVAKKEVSLSPNPVLPQKEGGAAGEPETGIRQSAPLKKRPLLRRPPRLARKGA